MQYDIMDFIIAFVISALVSFIVTPLIKKFAFLVGAVDRPDYRKKHTGEMARLGGLSIVIGATAGLLYLQPSFPYMTGIVVGGLIIVITGMIDDIFQIKAIYKLAGQILAAVAVVSSGLTIDKITMPFVGTVHLDGFGIFITIFWIVGVCNAINLIDGLDGLATGVSTIGLTSILVMAIVDQRLVVIYLSIILIGSCLGFLYHNFYPAKIFMGDTGALFLGYSIAVISVLGLFKNVALFSFIIPAIVIAIPVFDTLFAIIRRAINKQSIVSPDAKHIHYRLLEMGYSHRTSVLILYAFSGFFGIIAVVFNSGTLLASLLIILFFVIGIQLIAEISGIVRNGKQPVLTSIKKVFGLGSQKTTSVLKYKNDQHL